ncbi:MAG: hypothetical protein GF408_02860 [Candidatus Omnitrophica bacterium]|nr:hypothetical protein [Candidatus Omnitrophota bacterium]
MIREDQAFAALLNKMLSGEPFGRKDLQGVLSSLKRMKDNEIEHYALALLEREGFTDRTAEDILGEYRKLEEKGLEYLEEVSGSFRARGLRFFPMKSFRSYDYADDDLDIVAVDRRRKREYAEALKEAGFEEIWNASYRREPLKRFFVKASPGKEDNYPRIHMHFAVSWNGIEFLDAEKVWKRLVPVGLKGKEVYLPSPEDELLITAAHSMFENSYITGGELLQMNSVFSGNSALDTDHMAGSAETYNWRRGLRVFLELSAAFYRALTGKELYSGSFGGRMGLDPLREVRTAVEGPPYFFPGEELLKAYAGKFGRDLAGFRLKALPREVFTFGLVVWLFRRKKYLKFSKGPES